MTVVFGSILNLASQWLKPRQAMEVALEKKKFILSASMGTSNIKAEIKNQGDNWRTWLDETYNAKVSSYVVNIKGEKVDSLTVNDIKIAKEYKKDTSERMLPVYEIKTDGKIEAYVFPVAGFGLWDRIWGFVALGSDLNTVQGAVYDHVGETPGLGARITDAAVQERYANKKIYADNGELIGVIMQKGEGINYDDQPHKVDGMSGATLTAVGMNKMYVEYFQLYHAFIQKVKKENN